MNARYQDPVRGQFINEDPAIVGLNPNSGLSGDPNTATVDAFLNSNGQSSSAYINDPQALNYYSYGRDNPLRYTDPSGKWYISLYGSVTYGPFDVTGGLAFNGSGLYAIGSSGAAAGLEAQIGASF